MPDPDRLLDDLAGAVLDGVPVDWPAAEATAGPGVEALVRDLKLLASVASVHRNVPDDVSDKWGHLRLFERVGGGSFGEVFRAWDTQLDREVALKLLPAETPSRAVGDAISPFAMILGDAQSIIREGRLLARVRHPNVVTIHGAARIGGRVGLWMEFIHGDTLEQLVQQDGPFQSDALIAIGIELCRAVSAVHEAWLLHRDIKAPNVMRASDGRIVLMDFGTGRELNTAVTPEVAGTPLYLAPELLDQQPATVQSDVYSLGVLLYFLASGAYPIRSASLSELQAAHQRGERVPLRVAAPETSARLARIVDQAIDPMPERRFQTAAALGKALFRLQQHERRKPVLYAAAIVAVIAAIALAVWASRPPATAPLNAPTKVTMPGPPRLTQSWRAGTR
jgi:serine/threonine-protein kinase